MENNKKTDDFFNELKTGFEEIKISSGKPESTEIIESENDLQRTPEWFAKRRGCFSGSGNTNLMGCSKRATKKNPKDWTQLEWLFDFGKTALSYCLEKAIERITRKNISIPKTAAMQWGTNTEKEGKTYVENELRIIIKELDFVKFCKNNGASGDGETVLSLEQNKYLKPYGIEIFKNEKVSLAFELKCPQTLLSHAKLRTNQIAEGHDYFWQVQSEMLSLKADKCLFATYHPDFPEKTKFTVLSKKEKPSFLSKKHPPIDNVFILSKNTRLGLILVEKSPVHCNALLVRSAIGEIIIKKLMRSGLDRDLNEILEETYKEYSNYSIKELIELNKI